MSRVGSAGCVSAARAAAAFALAAFPVGSAIIVSFGSHAWASIAAAASEETLADFVHVGVAVLC
jgi:hypothetical protein